MQADFLFELGTEELPTDSVKQLAKAICKDLCAVFLLVAVYDRDWIIRRRLGAQRENDRFVIKIECSVYRVICNICLYFIVKLGLSIF